MLFQIFIFVDLNGMSSRFLIRSHLLARNRRLQVILIGSHIRPPIRPSLQRNSTDCEANFHYMLRLRHSYSRKA